MHFFPGYTNSHNPHPKLTEKRSSASSVSATTPTSPRRPCATDLTGLEGAAGTIVIGYRGTFAFGKDGLSDVKFRKLTRILVHGKVQYRPGHPNWKLGLGMYIQCGNFKIFLPLSFYVKLILIILKA